jgi:GntR family transcriptional regulator, arabinose operon transcriptional repressor
VRQAITELVHQNILFREQGKGTFVSQAQGPQIRVQPMDRPVEMRTIAVITTYLSDYIFPSIIRGVEQELSRNGYSILLFSTQNSHEQEERALRTLLQRSIDGLIVEPTKSTIPNPNIHLYFQLLERNVPLVSLHSSYQELASPSVRIDDADGALTITEHLIDAGHTRIGGIYKSDDLQGKYRVSGFIRAMQANHLPFHSAHLFLYTTEEREHVAQRYADMVAALPPDERPTAVACYNDEIAIQLMKALRGYGLSIPEDISVVGFDDSQLADAGEIGLTTMRHPKIEMGIKAASFILEAIERKRHGIFDPVCDYVFPTEIVIRGSVQVPHSK